MPCPPNILWIVTTQWRAVATGYAGDPNARTPALDKLAAESDDYRQAVTPHPFGPFARAALLTGVPSPQNGVVDYFDPLPASSTTVAHRLKPAGYHSAFFGKWHLAARDPLAPLVGEEHARMVVPPEARGGFEFWEGFEGGFLLNDPWLQGTRLPVPEQKAGYQSDVLCGRAADYLNDQSKGEKPRPWFAVVSLEAPHPPYAAPASGIAAVAREKIQLSANVPLGGDVEYKARSELAGYYAHIEATDRAIGRLMASVEANTWIVFTSVHGDLHGAHGLFRKGWPYEESVRVPLLIRPPLVDGAPRRGRKTDQLISLVNLPQLALHWARLMPPPELPEHALISMPSVVKLPLQCDRIWKGVRSPARKLVLNEDGSPWLYFDLEQDPGEMNNLVADVGRQREIEAFKAILKN